MRGSWTSRRFEVELDQALGYSDGTCLFCVNSYPKTAAHFSGTPAGGHPPYDQVMMLKVLIIQAQHTLSDDRTEFLINDRLSFMRLLGLGLNDRVPDAKTIWSFRERLTKAGAIKGLFARFDEALQEAGYIAMSGQIVDSTLVAAPRQRNRIEDKEAIKLPKQTEHIQYAIGFAPRVEKMILVLTSA